MNKIIICIVIMLCILGCKSKPYQCSFSNMEFSKLESIKVETTPTKTPDTAIQIEGKIVMNTKAIALKIKISNRNYHYEVPSNVNGNFTFSNVKAGTYYIRPDFLEERENIDSVKLEEGFRYDLKINIKTSPTE